MKSNITTKYTVYYVVQFFPWLKCHFPLFLGMKQGQTKSEPGIKLNHNIIVKSLLGLNIVNRGKWL